MSLDKTSPIKASGAGSIRATLTRVRVVSEAIPVEGGAVPTEIRGPEDARRVPVLFVVPSIFGAAPDLLERLSEFADRASIAVPDPFWRQGGGVIP